MKVKYKVVYVPIWKSNARKFIYGEYVRYGYINKMTFRQYCNMWKRNYYKSLEHFLD